MFARSNSVAPAPAPAARSRAAADAGAVQVTGKVIRVLFGDKASGRGMLLVQGDRPEPYKLMGALTFEPEVGMRVTAKAVPEQHAKYGEQFRAELIVEEIPVDRIGAVAYMARVLKGVGKATAERIFDAFGESAYDVIQNEPRRLIGVGGITETKLKGIVDSWNEDAAVRNIWTFLGRHGISGAVAARIYARFGAGAMQVAREQPYQLTSVEGLGFMTADKIAAENGVQANSQARIAGALEYALESAGQQGHTARPVDSLVAEVQKLTGLDSRDDADTIHSVIVSRVERDLLSARTLDGKLCVAPLSIVETEQSIAREIARLVKKGGADEAKAERAHALAQEQLKDDDQAAAVANVFQSPVSVVTGRPGCGKTTVTRVIVEVAKAAGLEVVMAAPTGKASRRMTEATGERADTVHSILRPERGNLTAFQNNKDHQLRGDVFIIDESSMMDSPITRAYLEAIPSGARVVFVGDVDQLPSVGAGNVLRDIIASGSVPVATLQTIHRTAMDSDIVVNAHRVINGDFKAIDLTGKKDFQFKAVLDDNATLKATLDAYQEMVKKYGVSGVQVIAARWGTPVGVDAVNAMLRQVVNPPSPSKLELEHGGRSFRMGDRVMRMSNNRELGVNNGEVGIVAFIDLDAKRVRVDFGDRVVTHEGKELLALEHAYATTMHKSQGSEYDGVITLTPEAHAFMLNRNLVYTSMTRGKKDSWIIGNPSTLRRAVSKLGSKRCTGLAEEIRYAFGGRSPAARMPGAVVQPRQALAPAPSQASLLDQPQASHESTTRASLFRRVRP